MERPVNVIPHAVLWFVIAECKPSEKSFGKVRQRCFGAIGSDLLDR